MNGWVRLLIIVCLSLVPGGCAHISSAVDVKLGGADSGKTIQIAQGGTLEIALAGNPTTGYLWRLISGNDAVLKPAGDPAYRQDAAAAGMVGVGGTFTFHFQAVGAGSARLAFGYLRPWERDAAPVETFAVTIDVDEPVPRMSP